METGNSVANAAPATCRNHAPVDEIPPLPSSRPWTPEPPDAYAPGPEIQSLPAITRDAIIVIMVRATVDEVEKDFPGYLHQVETGETVLVVRANQPVAEIKPVAVSTTERRPSGLCADEFVVPDDFDRPLPDDILDSFESR